MTSDVLWLSFPGVSFCFPPQIPQLVPDQVEFDHPCDTLHQQHQLDLHTEQTQIHAAPQYNNLEADKRPSVDQIGQMGHVNLLACNLCEGSEREGLLANPYHGLYSDP